jgi:GNAT superfamily N-acetyltransferase
VTIEYREGSAIDFDQLEALMTEVGWSARSSRARLEARVRGSHFVMSAWDGDALVGFARAISDGVSSGYVSDVAVRGDHRRQGIGAELVRRILADKPDIKFVLHADPKLHAFYAKLGFVEFPDILVRHRAGEGR